MNPMRTCRRGGLQKRAMNERDHEVWHAFVMLEVEREKVPQNMRIVQLMLLQNG